MQDGVRGFLAWLGRREPAAPGVTARARIAKPFHSVSIIAGPQACEAVQACAGQRYLSSEAPKLPLPGCGSSNCRCHYAHHDDRREVVRRIADGREAQQAPPYQGPERRLRSSTGRRDRD